MTFAPDVSKFQVPVDDSFNRDWLIFRVCFDGEIDSTAAHNLAWAIKAKADGRIKGFTGYIVPVSGNDSNQRCIDALNQLGFPHDAVVMIDAEKWNGQSYQINGDHSAQFNALATSLRQRQGGNPELVWAYGNRGPDIEVWPHKADWLGWVVADYTSGDPYPALPANAIGWQYTNGQAAWDNASRPHSTPPFGRCDHNVIYKLPATEEDMPLTDADILKIKQADIGDETIASALRETHDNVVALKAQVADLATQVAALKTAPVDVVALAQQLAQHIDLKVVSK